MDKKLMKIKAESIEHRRSGHVLVHEGYSEGRRHSDMGTICETGEF